MLVQAALQSIAVLCEHLREHPPELGVFTRVNTSSWQVFTLATKSKEFPLWNAPGGRRSVPTDSRPSSNSRFDNSFSLILISRGLVCLLEHIRNAEEDVVLQVEGM